MYVSVRFIKDIILISGIIITIKGMDKLRIIIKNKNFFPKNLNLVKTYPAIVESEVHKTTVNILTIIVLRYAFRKPIAAKLITELSLSLPNNNVI
jgi:hypothetical protein